MTNLFVVQQAVPPSELYEEPLGQDGQPSLSALLDRAREQVIVMSTLSLSSTFFRQFDPSQLRRGISYRAVFPDRARTATGLGSYLGRLSSAGAKIRTVDLPPMDAVVIDGSLAVLPADRKAASVVVMRLPSVVTATIALFDRVWATAVPFTDVELPDDADITDRERALLIHLSNGGTDDTAAAQLGISVRTVRRTVADIMNRLGARSRFQAGVKAADKGWLMERAG